MAQIKFIRSKDEARKFVEMQLEGMIIHSDCHDWAFHYLCKCKSGKFNVVVNYNRKERSSWIQINNAPDDVVARIKNAVDEKID
ncbi:MAG: hypothetical protein LUG50_13375 [Planctomycetaceae bacterium]|nr:hypothetical protein [Planctomycetaceae bacterium]